MLVVDAACLYEVVADTAWAEIVRERFDAGRDLVAPHLIDAEVLGVLRMRLLAGDLDQTSARLAVQALGAWRGERVPHIGLLDRAWELRGVVRTWDALYVALAELLGATLLTRDARLARAPGPRCEFDVVA